eukprot:TRINITY_DN3678_c0_g1_i5.p2 TRINITY_DN3678_c0_g1~~TRINITY_DN3678_c0_g1_i5.p2  ORF type:complete len:110 (+),score=21.54 TRINITY_DN3678_c0_g1_i5:566-895(+)
MRYRCDPSGWTSAHNEGHNVFMKTYPQQQQYRVYYNKNAYYPYGAVDIDHGDTAPALSAQECKDRCSERADCMCVTQETSTGMCWMRAECDPAGWRSPNNDGYNVFMKV